MPLYRYAPVSSPCKLCGPGFDHAQAASSPALASCPTCGQSVTRTVAHSVYAPKLLAPISVSAAKSAGFTVLKRVSSGEFEKQ
jgi:putative FmdB family regulatory protein